MPIAIIILPESGVHGHRGTLFLKWTISEANLFSKRHRYASSNRLKNGLCPPADCCHLAKPKSVQTENARKGLRYCIRSDEKVYPSNSIEGCVFKITNCSLLAFMSSVLLRGRKKKRNLPNKQT